MSNQKSPKRKRQEVIKRGGKYPLLLIVVMLVLIAIPTGIVVNLLYQGYMRTGTPIVGERFEEDLNPSITTQQINRIVSNLNGLNGVDSTEAHLQTGTLKIYINVEDEIASEAYSPLGELIVASVYEVLPEDRYFTSTETKRQYDLEINLYNSTDLAEEEPLIYLLAYKNAMMEETKYQMLSDAVNPELAEKLRADALAKEVEAENPNSEVGQEGVETSDENETP